MSLAHISTAGIRTIGALFVGLILVAACSSDPAEGARDVGTEVDALSDSQGAEPEDTADTTEDDVDQSFDETPSDPSVDSDRHETTDLGEDADSGEADGQDDAVDSPPDNACNGYLELCDRRLDEVAFPTTHNAMSNADEGWIAPNQQHSLEQQLDDGVRAMLLDTHTWRGKIYLCHTSCGIGSRLFSDALTSIAAWMEDNPREVLVFLLEDGTSVADTVDVFEESGLSAYAHTHVEGSDWPTLADLIALNERLVVTAQSGRPPPAWYHNLWDLVWDTPYSFDSADAFSCRVNRGSASNGLFLLNHWLSTPLSLLQSAEVVNQYDVLFGRAMECWREHDHIPNFVAVDFYAEGDLFEVVNALNGVGGYQRPSP